MKKIRPLLESLLLTLYMFCEASTAAGGADTDIVHPTVAVEVAVTAAGTARAVATELSNMTFWPYSTP